MSRRWTSTARMQDLRRAGWRQPWIRAALACFAVFTAGPAGSADLWSDEEQRDPHARLYVLFECHADCVVGIDVAEDAFSSFVSRQSSSEGSGANGPVSGSIRRGTGFVVDEQGFIVTSQRLFDGLAGDGVAAPFPVTVLLDDGRRVPGRLWAVDQLARVAIVKTDVAFSHALRFARAAPSVGAQVITLTRPYDLPTSLYVGLVNGLNRRVRQAPIERLMQTSLPLYPGGPGSPVLDASGDVVAMLQDSRHEHDISFALPLPRLEKVVRQLIEHRMPERGFLGVVIRPLTPVLCEQYRMHGTDCAGAVVQRVYEDSVAARVGILPDDVIVNIVGEPVREPDDLIYLMYDYRPGDEITITYRRGEELHSVALVLDPYPPNLSFP